MAASASIHCDSACYLRNRSTDLYRGPSPSSNRSSFLRSKRKGAALARRKALKRNATRTSDPPAAPPPQPPRGPESPNP